MEKNEPQMDEDGYAIGDPYASAAKMIDQRNAKGGFKKKLKDLATSIIDNRETVTQWEKLIKSAVCIAILMVMVAQSGALQAEDARVLPDKEIFQALGNKAVLWDFFSREGGILIVVVLGYLGARKYNEMLDQIELQMYLDKKQTLKAEKAQRIQEAKELGTVAEDAEDSVDEEFEQQEQEKPDKPKAYVGIDHRNDPNYIYPLNPKYD